MIRTDTPRELALFCDRTFERAAIREFLSRLQQGNGHEHPSVLSFYGVGGVGKTRLREKSLADSRAGIERDVCILTPPRIAEIDLDSDSVKPDTPVAQILGRVRTALQRQRIRTPSFDYLYLIWWSEENPGQTIDLTRRTEHEKIGAGFLDVAELASDLASLFGMALPEIAAAQGVRKLFPQLIERFERHRVRQRFDGTPEGWSQTERVERMPVLLANDLLDAIAHQPQTTICLVIDGFERVQSTELLPDAQRSLAALVAEVLRCTEILPLPEGKPLRGRIGFMILGREKLRWAELYSHERVRTNWQEEIDDHAQLLGLIEEDARSFLVDLAAPWERDNGRMAVAELIERHATQILQAASEQSKTGSSSFLPYYLDLAVMLIRDNVDDFRTEMLGKSPSELALRFLRYLKDQHREALQALALALEFDRETFAYLIERGLISGYTTAKFGWLVGDNWSFITPSGNRLGFHSFHRHMQDSLVASITMAEERNVAVAIVQALLERQYELAQFQVPAKFGPMQETAYSDAMNLVRAHQLTVLLDGATAVGWMLKFELLFDDAHAMVLRRPNLDWAVEIAMSKLGERHPDTLTSMNNLALTLHAQGDLAGTHALHEKVLEIRRRVLGEEHPDTLASMNNLAEVLRMQGELAGARALHEKVLEICRRVLGEEHPTTLTSMNNLALALHEQGDLTEACVLHEKVLAIRRWVLGEDHPDTLASMNNLAVILRMQGDVTD